MPTPETSFKEWSLNNLVKNTDKFLSNDGNLDKEELSHLNSDISTLKDGYIIETKEELKSFIKEQPEYKETKKEASKLSQYEIEEIQKYLGFKEDNGLDGIFGINTFIKLKNSNFGTISDYLKEKEEAKKYDKKIIENYQILLKGVKVDGILGIKTYTEYKEKSFSKILTSFKEWVEGKSLNKETLENDYKIYQKNLTKKEIKEEEEKRDKILKEENLIDEKMGGYIKHFISKFKNLDGVNTKNLAIILPYIKNPNARIKMDYHGKINVYIGEKLVYNFSELKSIKLITAEAIKSKNLQLIRDQFWVMPKNKKEEYVLDIKNLIRKYNYYSEARDLFSKKVGNNSFKINLSSTPSLQKNIAAGDLFGDKDYLIKNGKRFINYGNGTFLNEYTQEKLFINNGDIIKIGYIEKETIPKTYRSRKKYSPVISHDPMGQIDIVNNIEKVNLSKELGDWVTKDGVEFQNPDDEGKCGFYTNKLIEKFLETKGIGNAIKVETQRHGTNFNVILNNGYLNKDGNDWKLSQKDSFVSTYDGKETRQKDLRNNLTIGETLDKRIEFEKIDINFPKDALPGDILVYKAGAIIGSGPRKKYGHVEIVGSDGMYYYNDGHEKAAGSAHSVPQSGDPEIYAKKTGFTGYAYRLRYKKS